MICLTLDEYDIKFVKFVDGANPSFVRALKARLYEDPNYEEQIQIWKSDNGANVVTINWLINYLFVLPVAFGKYHKQMLAHIKEAMEYHNGQVAINPSHTKLITALRTAVENGEGSLDKEATSHDDLFDAFRLSLMFWH